MARQRMSKPAPEEFRHVLLGNLTWDYSYSCIATEEPKTGFPYMVINTLVAEAAALRGDTKGIGKVRLSIFPKDLKQPRGEEVAALGAAYQRQEHSEFVLFIPSADFRSILPLVS